MSRRLLAVLMALALLGSGCALIPGSDTYEVTAQFSGTYNLFVGSPVRVLGLDVGQITDVQVGPGDTAVTVTMQIDDDTRLPGDVKAVIIPEALLGERYVQFEPAYDGQGPTLEAGATVPVERTAVPAEFDEVLSSLNDFVTGLEEQDVSAFVSNLSDILEGNGEQLGQTIDRAAQAISVLKNNDEQLLSLAERLSDLNDTIASRDEQIGRLIEQWNTVSGSLADDRQQIDAAVSSLLRVVRQLGDVVISHRADLQADIATVTRVGRTLNRNLDNVSLAVLSSAELFRHADRVVDRQHNRLPLVDHIDVNAISDQIAESLSRRLGGICRRLEIDESQCDQIPLDEVLRDTEICVPPLISCTTDSGQSRLPLSEAVQRTVEQSPPLREALEQQAARDDSGGDGEDSGDDGGGLSDLAEGLLGGSDGDGSNGDGSDGDDADGGLLGGGS